MTAAKKQLVDIKLLKTLVPLSELDDQRLLRLQEHFVVEHIEAGTQLFAKGERDGLTYYLLSGQVQLTFVSGLEKTVNADTGVACRALAPEQPRTATAIAATPITLLSIESSLLHEVQSWGHYGYEVSDIEGDGNTDSDWMTLFLQSKVFLKLPAQNIQALMMSMEEITVRAGRVIIRQGDDDGYYYIIKRGHARVSRRFSPKDGEVELAVLGPGAGFGEEAIITNNRRGATVTMIDHGSVMRLSRNEFNTLLVEPLINELDYQEIIKNKNHVFLDVRSYDDYIEDGIAGSLNIPLAELRPKLAMLESGKQYVVCSNTSSRAAAAAFLLCQHGIDAVLLKQGLQGLPAEVKRGNHSAPHGDDIPLVDNVVSFKKSTGLDRNSAVPADHEQAMKDPRVQSLFSRAKRRVQHESQRAQQAEEARLKAESEVQRLKAEAEQARLEAEEAQRQVEQAAHQSAKAARLEAKKEAARLRESELGAKQAEMEEAVRLAEQEARRARNAEVARHQAEGEIERLKNEMQLALQQAQEEARKTAEAMRLFVEEQARKEKEAAERRAAEEQQEKEQALLRAEENALRAQAAEQARLQAEAEIKRLRREADEARLVAEQETARIRAEDMAKKQYEMEQAAQTASEQARRQAEREIEKLRVEAELARMQIQEQLSAEVARSEIEHEVARVRAEELAKKQWEMEEMARKAEEESARARAAEEARQQAELEIQRLKAEADATRIQIGNAESNGSSDANDALLTQALHQKQNEINAVARHAREEADRAREAEQAKRQAQEEIDRLREEVAVATLQAQAQLERDAERAAVEEQAVRQRTAELEQKEAQIQAAIEKAEMEARRAREAEQARADAEAEISRLRANEAAHNEAKQEIERLRAGMAYYKAQEQSKAKVAATEKRAKKEVLMVARKAAEEKRRAETAEQARLKAEREISRLKQEAQAERAKAEQTIKASLKIAKRRVDEKLVRMRAAEKARRLAEKKHDDSDQRVRQGVQQQRLEDTQRVRPAARPSPVKSRNTVDNEPLVDIMPNVVPEEPIIDLDVDISGEDSTSWVSDQVVWEATIGMREDKVAERVITPVSERVSTKISAPVMPVSTPAPAPAPASAPERARFTTRDVNPYVNTQRVNGVYRRSARGRVLKIVFAITACLILAGVGYFFTLDQKGKTSLQHDLHDMVGKDGAIKELTSDVKAKISHLSQSAKARIKSASADMARRAKANDAAGQSAAGVVSKKTKHHASAVKNEELPEPLPIEERVKLKVEKKLKQQRAYQERLKRKREEEQSQQQSQAPADQQSKIQPGLEAPSQLSDAAEPAMQPGTAGDGFKPVQLVDQSAVAAIDNQVASENAANE